MRSVLRVLVALAIAFSASAVSQVDATLRNWQAPPFWTPPVIAQTDQPAASPEGIRPKAATDSASSGPTPLPFVAITPCRLADTRAGSGFPSGYGPPSIAGGAQRSFTIAGQCAIPADAQAVSFNFAVWAPVTRGDLRVFPAGGGTPTVSTLNWEANILALANAAVVPLGTGGAITVQVDGTGTIDLFIDVNGYYSPLGVVNSVNTLSGAVTLAAGANTTITPSGQTLTISSAGSLTGVTAGTGISVTGGAPSPTVLIPPSGIAADRIASGQVVKSVNSQTDAVTIQGSGTVSVSTTAGTVTIGAPSGSFILGFPGDTTLIGAGYGEAGSTPIDAWKPTATTGAPSARYYHTAVWTGSKMIVWGGSDGGAIFNTGGQYDPGTDSWTQTSVGTNCPSGRRYHTAVWTGSQMIVWGGYDGSAAVDTGGRYSPGADTWATMASGPTARYDHSAVWTGSKMIVWGGHDSGFLNTGGQYDPSLDSWTDTSTGAGCPTARYGHTAVWTGSKMIVWGGWTGAATNTGAQYDPVGNSWTPTSTGSGCPSARYDHTAVWTGSRMIVWGRYASGSYWNTGGQYDPDADSWTATSTGLNCPSARHYQTAVWTGSRMILWGGYGGAYLSTGAQYDPDTDSWTAIPAGSNCPSARFHHTAVWTGSRMIVWGGSGGSRVDTGGQWLMLSLYVKN